MSSFETRVPGKWVLCGEHAVLRGVEAIALPHPEFSLSLRYRGTLEPLRIEPELSRAPVLEILRERGVLPTGELDFSSTIPLGAGLGSSAALCVALARWFAPSAAEPEIIAAATELEHRFHGRSSGMDVAVIAAGRPVAFTRGEAPRPLSLSRLPRFTFHDTGLRASTRDCVERVQAFGSGRDGLMAQASVSARLGLEQYARGESRAGLDSVAAAMTWAHDCFLGWGLVPAEAAVIQRSLLDRGALATKLTGAGGGGFVVALWES